VLPVAECPGSRVELVPELQERAVFELAVFELESVVPFKSLELIYMLILPQGIRALAAALLFFQTRISCKVSGNGFACNFFG
jgi:hypothetical protein